MALGVGIGKTGPEAPAPNEAKSSRRAAEGAGRNEADGGIGDSWKPCGSDHPGGPRWDGRHPPATPWNPDRLNGPARCRLGRLPGLSDLPGRDRPHILEI